MSSVSDSSNVFTTKDFVRQNRVPPATVEMQIINSYFPTKKEEREEPKQEQDPSVDVSIAFRNMNFELDRVINYLHPFLESMQNHTTMLRNNKHYRQAFLALIDEYRSKREALEELDNEGTTITSEKISLERSLNSSSLTDFINTLQRFQELYEQIHKGTKRYGKKKKKANKRL